MFTRLLRSIGPVEIADDRGRACPLVGPPEQWPATTWWGRTKGEVDAAMGAEQAWARKWGESWGALAGLASIFTVAWGRSMFNTGAGWPAWVGAFAAPMLLMLGLRHFAPLVARYYRVRSAAELRRAYRDVDRCASCGYALAGLAPEADGCVVCPECASAWRVRSSRAQRA